MTQEAIYPGNATQELWENEKARTFKMVPALEEMHTVAEGKTVADLFEQAMRYVVDPTIFPKAPALVELIGKKIEDVYGEEIAATYMEQLLKKSSVLNVQVHFSLLRSFDDPKKRLNDDGTVKPNEHYNSIILNSEILWTALCRHFGLLPLSATYGGIDSANETSPAFLQYGPTVAESIRLIPEDHKNTACLSYNPPKGYFYDEERDGIFPQEKYTKMLWKQGIFKEDTSEEDQKKILEIMEELWKVKVKAQEEGKTIPSLWKPKIKEALAGMTFPEGITKKNQAQMVGMVSSPLTDVVSKIPADCPQKEEVVKSLKTLEEHGFLRGVSRLYADQLNSLFENYKDVHSVETSEYEFIASLIEDKSTLTHYIHANPDVYKLFLDSYKDIAMGWQGQEQTDGTIAYDTLYIHTPTREKYPEEGYIVSSHTGFIYDPKTDTSKMVYDASALAEGYRTHKFSPKTIQTVIFDMIEGGLVLIGGVAQINYNKCVVERTKDFFEALKRGVNEGKYPPLPEGLTFDNLQARLHSMQENQRPLTLAGIAVVRGENPWELGDYGLILKHPEFALTKADVQKIMDMPAQEAMARTILALDEYKTGEGPFERRVGDRVVRVEQHSLSQDTKRTLLPWENLPALRICPEAASVIGSQGNALGGQGPNNPNRGGNQK